MTTESPGGNNRKQYVFNLTLAALTGQVGCLTLIIVLGAVFGGLYLDQRFGSRPMFTLILVIGSIPISLAVMFFVARAAVRRIKTQANQQEEQIIGSQK
jgi:MFS-type transporter involved in bile tolerance (Atg22 family)